MCFLASWVSESFHFIDYLRIPNVTPLLDAQWETNGFADKAVELLVKWINSLKIEGCKVEVIKEPGKAALILAQIDPYKLEEKQDTIILYGHYDKQRPIPQAWRDGKTPYVPVIEDNKLYGRGVADDGYATYTIFLAIKACQNAGSPHNRCVCLIEGAEESGSPGLIEYLTKLQPVFRNPRLVILLDLPCGDYERWWTMTSFRGILCKRV